MASKKSVKIKAVVLTPNAKDVNEVLKDEGKRITLLENVVQGFINQSMAIGEDSVTVKMSSKEIRDVTAASKDLQAMKRLNRGIND